MSDHKTATEIAADWVEIDRAASKAFSNYMVDAEFVDRLRLRLSAEDIAHWRQLSEADAQ